MSLRELSDENLLKYYSSYKHGMDNTKRFEGRKINGRDLKFLYHVVRLLNYAEQILTKHDLSLKENNDQIKAIRRGDWTEQQVRDYFHTKERELETVYSNNTLRDKPDEDKLKRILFECLETHYGSLDKAVVFQDEATAALREIEEIIDKLKRRQVLTSENQLQNREHQSEEEVPGCNVTGGAAEV